MDWANELEEMKEMSDNEYKMYCYHRFGVDNQIIGTVLFCIVFLIIGGFITCSYGQISKISKTAIKTVMDKNVAKAVVGKEITDGFLKQREIPRSNDFQQMYKNDTTLKGTAILPSTQKMKAQNEWLPSVKLEKYSLPKSRYYLNQYRLLFKDTTKLKNDYAELVKCFIKADSLVKKHPDILKYKNMKTIHSNVKPPKTCKDIDTIRDYLNRAKDLGNKEANNYIMLLESMERFKKRKTESNNDTGNKD